MNKKICQKIKYPINVLLLTCLAVFIVMITAACNYEATETTTGLTPEDTAQTTEQGHIISGRPNYPSGVMRLWWQSRESFNPLDDKTRSGQAVYDLIFQGLFRIGPDQSLSPVLAKTIEFNKSNTSAVITLENNKYFHNGRQITTSDIKACLDYLMAQESGLAEVLDLDYIVQIEIIDQLTMRIAMSQPGPWLAYSLTFPVIPAESVGSGDYSVIPGSGRYMMTGWQEDEGLWLELAESSEDISALDSILVKSYPDEKSAMKAFENDEIDLIWQDSDDYLLYSRRSDLMTQTFAGNLLVLLGLNSSSGRPLADPDNFLRVKQLLEAGDLRNDSWFKFGDPANLPLPGDSYLFADYYPDIRSMLFDAGDPTWQEDTAKITIVLPDDCRLRAALAQWASVRLERAGIENLIIELPADEFWDTIISGNYDIAILQAALPAEPEPVFLYGPQQELVQLSGQSIDGYGEYSEWQELLVDIWNNGPDKMIDSEYLNQALSHTAMQSPYICLMIRSEAILKSDRIRGQSNPDRYHPYEGIEEFWVWSS